MKRGLIGVFILASVLISLAMVSAQLGQEAKATSMQKDCQNLEKNMGLWEKTILSVPMLALFNRDLSNFKKTSECYAKLAAETGNFKVCENILVGKDYGNVIEKSMGSASWFSREKSVYDNIEAEYDNCKMDYAFDQYYVDNPQWTIFTPYAEYEKTPPRIINPVISEDKLENLGDSILDLSGSCSDVMAYSEMTYKQLLAKTSDKARAERLQKKLSDYYKYCPASA